MKKSQKEAQSRPCSAIKVSLVTLLCVTGVAVAGMTVRVRAESNTDSAPKTGQVSSTVGNAFGSETTNAIQNSPATQVTASVNTSPQGDKIADDRYVTITSKNYSLYADFYWNAKTTSKQVYGQTFHSTGLYRHQNGSTYLSLYDRNGSWHGYINAKAVTVGANQGGAWLYDDEYATISKAGRPIFDSLAGHVAQQSDAYLNQTFKVTGQYNGFDGQRYLSMYDSQSQWVGYVNQNDVSVTKTPQGVWQALYETVEVTSSNYQAWASFEFLSGPHMLAHTYLAVKGEYHHSNGSIYYSVYNLTSGKWIGYLNANATRKIDSPQGQKIEDNRYVTITSKSYPLYADFYWNTKHSAGSGYQWTFKSTGKYQHINGHTYLSLYNTQNIWQGYIDERAVTEGSGHQGAWLPANAYTTFTTKNVSSNSNFDGAAGESAANLFGNTYAITGQYRDFDWNLIYSIYDSKSKWHGYVNANDVAVTSKSQGLVIPQGGYVTTTQLNQRIWYSCDFISGWSTTDLYQKTYQIRGKYHAYNGNTYYSLWNNNNDWLGYFNASLGKYSDGAQGAWLSNSFKVRMTTPHYSVWDSFFGREIGNSSLAMGYTYDATGKYSHFNGSTYYSLYQSGKWIGYINADGVTPTGSRKMNVPWISQMSPYNAVDACAAVNLEMLLAWKGKDPGHYNIIANLPQAPYPGGQIGNPFTGKGWKSVIEPSALVDYGRRFYAGFANISGSSMNQIIAYVLSGHPVLYWGWTPYQSKGDIKRNHTHCIIGYDPNRGFLVTDPAYANVNMGAKSITGRSTDLGALSWRSVAYVAMEYGKQYGSEKVKRAIVMY